jgi:preprotein translocase subunit SecD
MHRRLLFITSLAIILFGSVLQAQAQFSIRAASEEPVQGWQRVEFENRAVWISPTVSLSAADIQTAAQSKDQKGGTAVSVFFTDSGEKKMRDLSKAQMNKLIAVMLDGTVLSAPRVRAEIGKEGLITGRPPNGLSAAEVQRILAAVGKK